MRDGVDAGIRSDLVVVRGIVQRVLEGVEPGMAGAATRPKDRLKVARDKIDSMLADLDRHDQMDATRWLRLLSGVTRVIRCLRSVLEGGGTLTLDGQESGGGGLTGRGRPIMVATPIAIGCGPGRRTGPADADGVNPPTQPGRRARTGQSDADAASPATHIPSEERYEQ